MPCSRGKASPNAATKLKLFTDSAGFCQNPSCNIEIFPKGFEGYPHIGEMAHIFAATDGGARTKTELTKEERGSYNNLIILCANCHTLVDKTPNIHSAKLMTSWKRKHAFKLQKIFGSVELSSRADLRKMIEPLLSENRMIHEEVGPDNDYRFNPEAAEATAWKTRVKLTIIPNSLKIITICDINSVHSTKEELVILEKFRFHVQGLILKHLEAEKLPNSRFPAEMDSIYR